MGIYTCTTLKVLALWLSAEHATGKNSAARLIDSYLLTLLTPKVRSNLTNKCCMSIAKLLYAVW